MDTILLLSKIGFCGAVLIIFAYCLYHFVKEENPMIMAIIFLFSLLVAADGLQVATECPYTSTSIIKVVVKGEVLEKKENCHILKTKNNIIDLEENGEKYQIFVPDNAVVHIENQGNGTAKEKWCGLIEFIIGVLFALKSGIRTLKDFYLIY